MNMNPSLERKEITAAFRCTGSRSLTPNHMFTAFTLLPKILYDGVDDVPHDAWRALAAKFRPLSVNLRVHEHPPHGAFGTEPDVPLHHLFVAVTGASETMVDEALNGHDDDFQAIVRSYAVIADTRDFIRSSLFPEDESYAAMQQAGISQPSRASTS